MDESSRGFKARAFITHRFIRFEPGFLSSYSGPKSEAELNKKRFVFDSCVCLNPRYVLLFC